MDGGTCLSVLPPAGGEAETVEEGRGAGLAELPSYQPAGRGRVTCHLPLTLPSCSYLLSLPYCLLIPDLELIILPPTSYLIPLPTYSYLTPLYSDSLLLILSSFLSLPPDSYLI